MKKGIIAFILLSAAFILVVFSYYSFVKSGPVESSDNMSLKRSHPADTEAPQTSPEKIPIQESPNDSVADKAKPIASKLAAYSGFGHKMERDEEIFSQEEVRRESLISNCMGENSFEYTPAPSTTIDEAAINSPEEFERLLVEASSDPNEEYVKSLSPEMRRSYYVTLTGMEDPNDPEGQSHELSTYNDSCVGKAFTEAPGVYEKRNLLSEEFDAMETSLKEDKRILAATEQWSQCMNDNGYIFSNPSEVYRKADESMAKLFEGKVDTERAKHINSTTDKMIKKMNDCSNKSKLSEVKNSVRVEYENKFVKDNQSQLTNKSSVFRNLDHPWF